MKSMAKKGFGNGRAALDNGYGKFLPMLEYKLADRGNYLIKVDKWFPSSQICSCCGRQQKLKLTDKVYQCCCVCVMDRDYNVAVNIRNESVRLLKEAV